MEPDYMTMPKDLIYNEPADKSIYNKPDDPQLAQITSTATNNSLKEKSTPIQCLSG